MGEPNREEESMKAWFGTQYLESLSERFHNRAAELSHEMDRKEALKEEGIPFFEHDVMNAEWRLTHSIYCKFLQIASVLSSKINCRPNNFDVEWTAFNDEEKKYILRFMKWT